MRTGAQSEATAARVLGTARHLFTERGLFEAVLAEVQRSVADAVEREAGAVTGDWQ